MFILAQLWIYLVFSGTSMIYGRPHTTRPPNKSPFCLPKSMAQGINIPYMDRFCLNDGCLEKGYSFKDERGFCTSDGSTCFPSNNLPAIRGDLYCFIYQPGTGKLTVISCRHQGRLIIQSLQQLPKQCTAYEAGEGNTQ